jgi:hypothetical protein
LGEREGAEWVVSGDGVEMTQALYAHMNNKIFFKSFLECNENEDTTY